jgi:enediyne biosynthesis protein E4
MVPADVLHSNFLASHTSTDNSLRIKKQLFTFLMIGSCIINFCSCHKKSTTLFQQILAPQSNILFNNRIIENDSINPIDMEFLYNGGGVAIADFNNDSLADIYFTGSMVSNQLYLNKGAMQFEEVTDKAHVAGEKKWCNGAAIIDINNDGKKDIYLCATVHNDANRRANILYVNQGNDKNGIPQFANEAAAYGLADTSFSVQAAFLDYDKDGDLDMYLVTTKLTSRNIFTFSSNKDSSTTDFDKLYRNDWDAAKKHPFFKDVSQQAGIVGKGYGLGISVGDINLDGWPDIYVTNDFISSDHLWINQRDGTFSNKVNDCLKHTSQNAMGNDMVDVNNDALPDLIAVDMNPEDNYRKQKNMASLNYAKYRNMKEKGYAVQFVRNTLQINQGPTIKNSNRVGENIFCEVSYYAGMEGTDWSWTPSVADFDNDGQRDLLITNGYPKDVTDHDYISYRKDNGFMMPRMELLKQIPEIKLANYAFRNKGQIQFEDVTKSWGLDLPSYSTGAAYADLDNDGDLDYVINNINEAAFLYANQTTETKAHKNNFLRLQFVGSTQNVDGIGATVIAWYHQMPHLFEQYPWRGYLGTVEMTAHFGLESLQQVDSLCIQWPNGKKQLLKNVQANQTRIVFEKDAVDTMFYNLSNSSNKSLFTNISGASKLDWLHTEYDFVDFDVQRLLPHKLSEYGPSIAVGDVDGNGTDDLYVCGATGKSGVLIRSSTDGKLTIKNLLNDCDLNTKPWEETGSLLFDADNDKDLDLYVCSGSNELKQGDTNYVDRLYLNDNRGNFVASKNVIPQLFTSKNVVKAADFDNDGDLDLFIGSRNIPQQYPKPASGYLLRNDLKNGVPQFTDITKEAAPALQNIGMISDALWSDFDNDGFVDLIVCGEFMSITSLQNKQGIFLPYENDMQGKTGLWNSLIATDVDNDGDMDYIAGNAGLNSFYKGTTEQPFSIYANDFDKNGSFDALPFLYLKDQRGQINQFPCFTRDDMAKQMIRVKGDFPTYKSFATASLQEILKPAEIKNTLLVSAHYFETSLLKNNGRGKFDCIALPYQAQWSTVFGMLTDDFNADGFADLLLSGNDYGMETNTGQADAMNGLLLLGDGKGNFIPQTIQNAGIHIPLSGIGLAKMKIKNQYVIAASQNKGQMLFFGLRADAKLIPLASNENVVFVELKNGQKRKEEFFWGSSFLSQSGRYVLMNESMNRIIIKNSLGAKRIVEMQK